MGGWNHTRKKKDKRVLETQDKGCVLSLRYAKGGVSIQGNTLSSGGRDSDFRWRKVSWGTGRLSRGVGVIGCWDILATLPATLQCNPKECYPSLSLNGLTLE